MATLAAEARRARAPVEQPQQGGLALTYHRLMLVMLLFVGVTLVIVGRLAMLQVFTDRTAHAAAVDPLLPARGDIVDRNGVPLARTIDAWAIAARPRDIIGDRAALAQQLARLMPERTAQQFYALLSDRRRTFVYLARPAAPELVQAVNALGEPGLVFNREPERLYPQTALAGHVIGWTAEGRGGIAGMEKVLQDRLVDPAQRGRPVALSLDTRVQAILESELSNGVATMQAAGGSGIVLDVDTGEVVAMASAPIINPNDAGRAGLEAMMNRATVGVYELGSTFKPITIAAAIEAGVVRSMNQRYDASAPIQVGRFRIRDDHPMGRAITIPELMVHSSNIATARVADEMGPERMQAAFRALGFNTMVPIEIERGRPIWPHDWGRLTVMTSGYGHGVAISPLHLALAYAALVNGGTLRPATLLRVEPGHAAPGRRVYQESTSYRIRQLLRLVVMRGTGRNANAPGFRVGGKTGTAETVSRTGGYNRHQNVSTFAAAFPMDAPRYVVLVMIDSARPTAATSGQTTAAWTAAPIVSRVISRAGPLLGIIPDMSRDIPTGDLMPPERGNDENAGH
ncbi:MAG TPA: penicillin-binding protein 2 [Allosphingosinicella sp.]|nr:penicillin-binding protein 2 [Allosphingosinicella sp.]